MRKHVKSAVTDETGSISTARLLFWLSTFFLYLVSGIDVYLTVVNAPQHIPNIVYSTLATVFGVLGLWAGTPRVAKYLGPQISAITGKLAQAVRDKREPDMYKDDERGKYKEREEV